MDRAWSITQRSPARVGVELAVGGGAEVLVDEDDEGPKPTAK
jgi:hypothetical protein